MNNETDITLTNGFSHNGSKQDDQKPSITSQLSMSSSTNTKYGPSKNNHYDSDNDERNEKDVEFQDENQNVENIYDTEDSMEGLLSSEAKLAAISRADPNIVRATDNNIDATDDAVLEENELNETDTKVVLSQESLHEQAYNDALEFESLLFSIRRTSARSRLLKIISTLRLLADKLERSHEVKKILNQQTPKETQVNDKQEDETDSLTTGVSRKRQRSDDNDCEVAINGNKEPKNRIMNANDTDRDKDVSSLTSLSNKSNAPSQSQPDCPNPRSQPPLLKQTSEWVKLHQKYLSCHCPDFSVSNTCPLGKNCPRYHVFHSLQPNTRPMTKEFVTLRQTKNANHIDLQAWYTIMDVERAYKLHRDILLTKECVSEKVKPDEFNIQYYTCYFRCPVENIVYFAQPFPGDTFVNGNKSSQGIWWYLTMKDAKESLATQVIRDLQSRKIIPDTFLPEPVSEKDKKILKNYTSAKAAAVMTSPSFFSTNTLASPPEPTMTLLPSILPDIKPWNWAEYNYTMRCANFNQPHGCKLGRHCALAHVHIPKVITTDRLPSKGDLPDAYKKRYNVYIQDPFFQPGAQRDQNVNLFHVKTVIDSRNQIWYTAAFTCPIEKILFYAAGGTSGRQNPQGFILYPSVEEAKLAVCGVVLNSFAG